MRQAAFIFLIVFAMRTISHGDETFVIIQKVSGNRITFVPASQGGRGRGRGGADPLNNVGRAELDRGAGLGGSAQTPNVGGPGGAGRGRGMLGRSRGRPGGRGASGRSGSSAPTIAVTVPADAKITAAMRERRTFEFRVGVELAGRLRHPVFTNMQQPLSARIVTRGNRITELNVITEDTDINQLNTTSSGQTVIAVQPKRPPSKRKP